MNFSAEFFAAKAAPTRFRQATISEMTHVGEEKFLKYLQASIKNEVEIRFKSYFEGKTAANRFDIDFQIDALPNSFSRGQTGVIFIE